jgi:hypothetical protein
MRSDVPAIQAAARARAGATGAADRVATFTTIRAWKNDFR